MEVIHMKILHILFDDYPFISDWGYQENKISYYQSINNEVFIISAKYVPHILNEFITYDLKEYEKYSIEGHKEIKIFRLKCLFGQTVLAKKIKCYKGLYSKIKEICGKIFCRGSVKICNAASAAKGNAHGTYRFSV